VKMNGADESGWSDVSDAAGKMFNVWVDGHELEWAREAWGHLHPAGLEGEETCLKVTAAKLHLVTLARVYQEFCGLAWEENPETPVDYLAEDLDMDSVALGILAAASSDSEYFKDAVEDHELREAALLAASDGRGGKSLSNSKLPTAAMSRFTRAFGIRDQIPTVSTQTKSSNRLLVIAPHCKYVMGGFEQG
jgi:hypothetical protein